MPVALVTPAPLLLVANNDVPAKTAAELIALAKAKPGTLSFGSYGNGSSNHLVAELFNTMAGIETNHIPYRGSAPMMTDLIGGRIQFAFDGIATTLGYIRGSTVRLLGVSTTKRSPLHPGRADDFRNRRCRDSTPRSGSPCSRRPARPGRGRIAEQQGQ